MRKRQRRKLARYAEALEPCVPFGIARHAGAGNRAGDIISDGPVLRAGAESAATKIVAPSSHLSTAKFDRRSESSADWMRQGRTNP